MASGCDLTVVLVFLLDGCEVSDRGVEAVLVEPAHPGEWGEFEFEFVGGAEWDVDLDALRFVEPDDALREAVVIAVADGSDRGDRADIGESLGIAN